MVLSPHFVKMLEQLLTPSTMKEKPDMIELMVVQPFLTRFAKKLDYHNWEDLLQDTNLRILEYQHSFNGTNMQGWAGRIMFNIFVDQRRRKKWQSGYEIPEQCSTPNQEDHLYLKQVLETANKHLVKSAMGYSYNEIAKENNLPIGTIRSRICRARKDLE